MSPSQHHSHVPLILEPFLVANIALPELQAIEEANAFSKGVNTLQFLAYEGSIQIGYLSADPWIELGYLAICQIIVARLLREKGIGS
ncbi:MAG TPA: hypothetical protein VGD59_07360 [Acidisarcina sp.]